MHPSMPEEPLVILHCALQQGAASSMNDILHPHQLQLAHPDAVGEPHGLLYTVAPSTANHSKHCKSVAWCLSITIRLQNSAQSCIWLQNSPAIMCHQMLRHLMEFMIISTARHPTLF